MIISISPPGETIAFISIGLAVMNTLVRRAVLDRGKLQEQKKKLKEHQRTIKEATKAGDMKRARKAQEDLIEVTMEQMKHSFKPMIFTTIPFLLIFNWLRGEFGSAGNVATLFGFGLTWFYWYLICSITMSIAINKVFRIS